jgi:hypothetical protein
MTPGATHRAWDGCARQRLTESGKERYPRRDSNNPAKPCENNGPPGHTAQKAAHSAQDDVGDLLPVVVHRDGAPTEQDYLGLLDALESLDDHGRREFLSKLPAECRTMLLACARHSRQQPLAIGTGNRVSSIAPPAPKSPRWRIGGCMMGLRQQKPEDTVLSPSARPGPRVRLAPCPLPPGRDGEGLADHLSMWHFRGFGHAEACSFNATGPATQAPRLPKRHKKRNGDGFAPPAPPSSFSDARRQPSLAAVLHHSDAVLPTSRSCR